MLLSLPILDTAPQRPTFAAGPRSLDAVRLLRLSVTDRCNLRCVYCMPAEGMTFAPMADLLSPAELQAVAAAAVRVGIRHLKITGGEPTVRADLLDIVRRLAALQPDDLSLTTNGLRLTELAQPLREAGLDRLTVSWDTMQPTRFDRINRGWAADHAHSARDAVDAVRRGLEAAAAAGFTGTKINTVVIGGINDDEVVDFARLTLEHDWTVRFIEYMPLGHSQLADAAAGPEGYIVDSALLKQRIAAALGPLVPVNRTTEVGVGPAEVFALPNACGRIGFISAMSQPFCESCNRLRLTATGELRSCLFDGGEVDILPLLRDRPPEDHDGDRLTHDLIDAMQRCVAMKPDTHSARGDRAMSQLGG